MSFTILALLILAYLFVRFFHNWRPDPWPHSGLKLPPWQVHRGYWISGNQENTTVAFREAARRGFSMVELDVQLSKDGIPIVFHDSDLRRLAQLPHKVSDLTAQELKAKVQAPTLEEVLMDKEITPYINIEIKNRSARDQKVTHKVVDVVKKTQSQHRIIFSSFNPITLRMLWKYLPEVPRALLATNDKTDPDSRIYLRYFWLGGIAHANMLNLDKRMITPDLMKRLSERKIPVAAWTVNDSGMAEALRHRGVVSIISDQPST